MTNPLSLPIARLRAAGAKVSTVIGHDPAIGDLIYSVTPPAAYTLDHLVKELDKIAPEVRVRVAPDGERIVVSVTSYRTDAPLPPKTERARRAGLLAATLHAFADKIGA